MNIHEKRERLHHTIREMGSALVTFSGGIDSTLLAKVAYVELKNRAAALTAISPSLPAAELEECRKLAETIGINHILVETHELEDSNYVSNPDNRCYFCKEELFSTALAEARKRGYAYVLEGTHSEDLQGHRPGFQAAKEQGIRSPFVENQFTKEEIRQYARELGLPNWDKPALACLASRFPTGTTITLERLRQIDQVESMIRAQGFSQLRARYHGDLVRIEVAPDEYVLFENNATRKAVLQGCQKTGFHRTTLDLQPYGMARPELIAALPLGDPVILTRLEELFSDCGLGPCEPEKTGDLLNLRMTRNGWEKMVSTPEIRKGVVQFARSLGLRFVVADLALLETKKNRERVAVS